MHKLHVCLKKINEKFIQIWRFWDKTHIFIDTSKLIVQLLFRNGMKGHMAKA